MKNNICSHRESCILRINSFSNILRIFSHLNVLQKYVLYLHKTMRDHNIKPCQSISPHEKATFQPGYENTQPRAPRHFNHFCAYYTGLKVVVTCVYRGANKGLYVLLSRTQAGRGRTVKQEQEEISHNHMPRLFLSSVDELLDKSIAIANRLRQARGRSSCSPLPCVRSSFVCSLHRATDA